MEKKNNISICFRSNPFCNMIYVFVVYNSLIIFLHVRMLQIKYVYTKQDSHREIQRYEAYIFLNNRLWHVTADKTEEAVKSDK